MLDLPRNKLIINLDYYDAIVRKFSSKKFLISKLMKFDVLLFKTRLPTLWELSKNSLDNFLELFYECSFVFET